MLKYNFILHKYYWEYLCSKSFDFCVYSSIFIYPLIIHLKKKSLKMKICFQFIHIKILLICTILGKTHSKLEEISRLKEHSLLSFTP